MRLYLVCAASVVLPLDVSDLALQGPFIDVAADAMVDLDYRCQCALPEARYRPHRKLSIRRRQLDLVPFHLRRVFHRKTEFQPNTLQQVPRAARMTSRPAADADRVVAL